MLALSARSLGLDVVVLEPNPDAPARTVATHLLADYDDPKALAELKKCDWITFEFENIPEEVARDLESEGSLAPPVEALRISQDRLVEKCTFQKLGIPTVAFRKVDDEGDALRAFEELGPMVLKTRRFGYDGKGQVVVRKKEDVPSALASLKGAPAIAEELVPFDRELSVLICRSGDGQSRTYPITENHHLHGVLRRSEAPAPDLSEDVVTRAMRAAEALVQHFDYVGVLALELFLIGDELRANEFAPRVHNSGHWTIEGAKTSQFENHVRAVTGLPLGSTELRAPCVMTNLLGTIPPKELLLAIEDTHLHDYDKEPRAGRKVGHVTSLGQTRDEAGMRARSVAALIK